MQRTLPVLLAIGILLSGCQEVQPIKIGFAGGITGTNSSIAISGRNAVLLAVEEINRAGGIKGRPVELVIKDDHEDPKVTAAVDQAFIQEGVPVVIGHYVSSVASSSLTATEGQDFLMVSPTISTRELSGRDDNFLRLILTNSDQGNTLAAYSAGAGAHRRSYLVYNNGNKAFVEGVTAAYKETFRQAGGAIVGEVALSTLDTVGMTAAIKDAKAVQADSFLVVMNANDVAIFAQLMKKMESILPVYSATWGMTADVVFQGGEAVEGIIFPAMFDSESRNERYLAFKKAYEALYDEPVDFSALYSYEAAQVVFEGLRNATDTNAAAIKRAILEKGTFQGLQTEFRMDASGDVVRPRFINTIKDGKFLTIGRAE